MRLVAADRPRVGRGQHREPYVVVKAGPIRHSYQVDVQIDRDRIKPETVDARLLGGLAEGGRRQGLVAGLAVTADLHPPVHLAVQAQQDAVQLG